MALGGICALAPAGESGDAAIVERMAAGVAWRAAGGVSTARVGGAVLTSLVPALATTPADRGLAVEGPLAVAADARLIRRPDRLSELTGEAGRGATDAELILAAYRRWGEACPDRLLGEFAFALWDCERRTLLCARDPVGARPLRWAESTRDQDVRVASSPRQILAAGDVPEALDETFFADLLAGSFDDLERTPFAAIRNVPPGGCVAFGPDGRRSWRWWHPERAEVPTAPSPGDGSGDEEEWVAAFRELLFRVVEDHLGDVDGAAALMTSGGLDSSTVAAIAQGLRADGAIAAEPVAFVHVFDRLRSCDEWRWASELVATGIAMERIPSDELSHVVPDPSWAASGVSSDEPMGLASELTARALDRARERGCTVVTTGYGGDTLFDAARWHHHELVRRGRWVAAWPWAAGAHARGAGWPRALAAVYLLPLLGRRGRRGLDRLRGAGRYWRSPPWLRPEHRERAEARRDRGGHPRRFRSRARQDQYEHLVGLAQQGPAIDLWSAQAARRGIEARFPLLDRRLAELVLAAPLPLGARPGPGGSKHLLRRAVEGVLPEAIRRRPDKGTWGGLTRDSLCRRLSGDFGSLFGGATEGGGSRLAALGLVDDGALRTGLEEYCGEGGTPGFHGSLLAIAYLAERWLRDAGVVAPQDDKISTDRRL